MNTERCFLEEKTAKELGKKHVEYDLLLENLRLGDTLVLPILGTDNCKRVSIKKIENKIYEDQESGSVSVKHLIINDGAIILAYSLLHSEEKPNFIIREYVYTNSDGLFVLPHYLGYFAPDESTLYLWVTGHSQDSGKNRFLIKVEDQVLCSELNVKSIL